jgi:OPA family glycerol-3-phosphate transporter-like MFS transporter
VRDVTAGGGLSAGTAFAARRRQVFLVAYLGYAACYLVRNNVAVVSELLTRELGVSATQVGGLLAGFTLSYGLGKLVMGVVVDQLSLRYAFAWGLGISAVLCCAMAFLREPWALGVALVLIGLVQGACAPAALAMIGAWYPPALRGSRVAVWNTSQNVGALALPMMISGGLALTGPTDWRIGFWAPGLVALVCALLVGRSGGERPWQEGFPTLRSIYGEGASPAVTVPPEVSYWKIVRVHVIGNRVLGLLLVLNSLLYLLRFGVLNWLPIYQIQENRLTQFEASLAITAFEWGAIPGSLVFALIARRWPDTMATAASVAVVLLGVSVVVYAGSGTADMVVAAVVPLGALVYGPQVIVNVLTLNFVSPRAIGVAVGWVGLGGYLVGALLANTAIPRIASWATWDASLWVLVLVCALCALICLRLRRHEAGLGIGA